MIRFDNIPPEIMQAMCTPMHHILSVSAPPPSMSRTSSSSSRPPISRTSSSSHKSPYPTPPSSGSPSPSIPASPLPGAGSLYLGSMSAIQDPAMLRAHRVSVVVQVIDAPWIPPLDEKEFTCYKVPVMDATTVDLTPYLEGVCGFMDGALRDGRGVLVHCQQGVSRSTAIVIAYLIRCKGMSYDEAFQMVLRKRPCAKPNEGFIRALRDWEGVCRRGVADRVGGGKEGGKPLRPEMPRRFTS